MTILCIPVGQEDRQALLTQVSARLRDELMGGTTMNPLLTQELFDLTAAYTTALQTLTTRRSTKAILALAKATRLRDLIQLIRDFRVVTQRRAKRDPKGQRLVNILAVATDLPSASQSNGLQWLRMGQQLVTAEAEAIRQGFEPSANPSIAELEALMEGSEQLFAATDEACYALKTAQIELAELNEEVGPKLRFLGAHLRTRFRKHSKSEIRALMRTYGFAYKSSKPTIDERFEKDEAPTKPDLKPEAGQAAAQHEQSESTSPRPSNKEGRQQTPGPKPQSRPSAVKRSTGMAHSKRQKTKRRLKYIKHHENIRSKQKRQEQRWQAVDTISSSKPKTPWPKT